MVVEELGTGQCLYIRAWVEQQWLKKLERVSVYKIEVEQNWQLVKDICTGKCFIRQGSWGVELKGG